MLEWEKVSYENMPAVPNVILKISIILGMMAAVMALVYLSPLPDQVFESCDRPCHDLDWPMICRFKFYIESPKVSSSNRTSIDFSKITTNGLSPSPSIHVCQNDILVIDVVNKIPGHSMTIHWRGQPNHEAPFMDGVPMVTQCPISSYTTFQYKFRASSPGTHYYHAHSDDGRSRGLYGALIVRQSHKIEPLRKFYDMDVKDHVILVSELRGVVLINGKDNTDPITFKVTKGKRYRFRLVFAASNSGCPISVTIDNHLFKLIALDGNPVNPYESSGIILNKGERVDFVLKTNQDKNGYYLKARLGCGDAEGVAVINYSGRKGDELKVIVREPVRFIDTATCESGIGKVCLGDIKSFQKMPEWKKVDLVLYLAVDARIIEGKQHSSKIHSINNFTFTYPSSPLLTQLSQVSPDSVCHVLNVPEKCREREICECVHVEYIPEGASAEIILINKDSDEHIFHLHGHHFYVVSYKKFDDSPTVEQIKLLDQQGSFVRNSHNPPLKDTIRLQKYEVVVIRFIATTPGFWMLRDENSKGWTRGMDMVLQIGSPSVTLPSYFPTCGDFIGPDYFFT